VVDRKRPEAPFGDDPKAACDSVRVTRRMVTALLTASAGAAAAQAAQRPVVGAQGVERSPNLLLHGPFAGQTRTFNVIRPDDMLILDITLVNLAVQGGKALVRVNAGQPGLLVVEHQPQAIADQAYQETTGQHIDVGRDGSAQSQAATMEPSPVPPKVAASRMAGASRVVFAMPTGQTSFSWGAGSVLDGLLEACRAWPMALEDTARPAPIGQFWRMRDTGTALNLLQDRLDRAHGLLRASLPARDAGVLLLAVDGASVEVAPAILQGIRHGRPMTEPEIDFMIGDALDRRLGTARCRQTDETLVYARRAVEAAAASGAVLMAQTTEPAPRRTPPVLREPAPRTTPPAPTPTTPGARQPPFRLPDIVQPPPTPAQPGKPPARTQPLEAPPPRIREPGVIRPPQREIPDPHEPSDLVTALEIPFRLFQSPLATAGWAHAKRPVSRGSRTELWHTRLGTRRPWGVDDRSTEPLRAIWSWDYPADAPVDPAPPPYWALNGDDRRMLVKLTAGFNQAELLPPSSYGHAPRAYTPKPAQARRLMLTALGGWLDLDGAWDQRPPGVDIQAWSHKTAMARDYFVRVVYAGYLFPFGHAASLVKVSERKFESQADGGRAAVLRQRFFIIVREPVRTYPGQNQAFEGRDFPFRSVEILTKVTPNLVPPGENPNDRLSNAFYGGNANLYREAFFPVAANGDFQFQMAGIDGAGRRIPFQAPLLFLSETRNNPASIGDSATADTIAWKYATSQNAGKPRSQVAMLGGVIQYAPQSVGGDALGDTNIPTDWAAFQGARPTAAVDPDQPLFHPRIARAQVVLPAVKHLLASDKSPTVAYPRAYLDSGFSAGPGQVFLDIQSPVSLPVDADNPTDKFGGMISPNLAPNALSRSFGVVTGAAGPGGNAAKFLSGTFDPTDFLPGDAKLLGFIPLKDVLRAVSIVSNPEQTPRLTNLDLPDRIEVGFSLTQGKLNSPSALFVPSGASVLHIESRTIAYRNGAAPLSTVDGSLSAFKINLFGFIILSFDNLSFHAEPGKKPDVGVDLNPENGVMFGGPLEFVNALKDFIPSNGFADPPGISVTPSGVSAGYGLALPTIAVGAMSLQNVSIGAAFNLPFTGAPPSVRFNFAERHNPFNLTISLYGGGGFVAITVDTGGVRELEAALEFGAQVSIDLGVASGGVYIKGGFYFHWRDAPDQLVFFEGYVELGGHLTVLGLITASLVFHLGLAYEKTATQTRLFGQATLTVEVDVLFFSASVGVTVEKQFAGSEDPRFIAFIPDSATWGEYCDAFA